MKYMIDVHGFIDTYPKKVLSLLQNLVETQNEVIICSGGKLVDVKKTLKLNNFIKGQHYHEIISLTDYILEFFPPSEIEFDVNENVWIDDLEWWKLKGKMCEKYSIDVIIDDNEEYFMFMPKNVIKLLIK